MWQASNVREENGQKLASKSDTTTVSEKSRLSSARMIYGLTNSKGGVGKTTVAVHLAAFLADKKRSVLFIDADPQQSAAAWIKELSFRIRFETLVTPEEIIRRVANLANDADDVVIDGPAGLSETTRAIMLRADKVFLPCGPSILDLRAAQKAVLLLHEAQKVRKGPPKGALIPNKLHKRGRLSREMLDAVHKLKIPVLGGLSMRQAFADAAGQAKVVGDMGASALLAAHEMKQLMKEMTRG
jgi:chromosome partitioning protein